MTGFLHELEDGVMPHKIEPLPVKIVTDKIEAAEYASLTSFVIAATAPVQPLRLMAQDQKRRRAVIMIKTAVANTGTVRIGQIGDVTNGQGGILFDGQTLVMENQREWFFTGDGVNAATITVLDERYQ